MVDPRAYDREYELQRRRTRDDFWIICVVLVLVIIGALGGIHVIR